MSNKDMTLIQEFGTNTFSDRLVIGKGLGRARRPRDKGKRLEVVRSAVARTSGSQMWANPIQLNQGSEGACVGFGWTGLANSEPMVHEYNNAMGFKVYGIAQDLDPFPNTTSGTTVQAGAEAMRKLGHIREWRFTDAVRDLALFVLNHGPAVIGVDWYTGMDRVDSNAFIHVSGSLRGGHCVVVDGVVFISGTFYFRIRNSWGLSWGFNGRARISGADMHKLLLADGDACMAIEVA